MSRIQIVSAAGFSERPFMSESLEEVKRRLRDKYLGKEGIHGLGIRRSQNALCVYAKLNSSREQNKLLQELKNEAAPYQVMVIDEEPPRIS